MLHISQTILLFQTTMDEAEMHPLVAMMAVCGMAAAVQGVVVASTILAATAFTAVAVAVIDPARAELRPTAEMGALAVRAAQRRAAAAAILVQARQAA